MHLVVRSIDFAEKAVSVEIGRSTGASGIERLSGLVACCSRLGFSRVELRHPARLSQAIAAALERIEKSASLPKIALVREEENAAAAGSVRAAATPDRRESGDRPEYRVIFTNLATALDDLTAAVLIGGAVLSLDQRTLAHLKLCLYELTANTVEHARFEGAQPEIRVEIVAGKNRIDVEFRDNAAEFSTIRERRIDIGERIRGKNKRGLGLYLLGRMTTGLRYERESEWNRTRFSISRTKRFVYDLYRRLNMNELAITVDRTASSDTAVVKPAGSINSSTVAKLDASINDLVHEGRATIVLDLSATDFISSSGVGLLVGTVQTLREKNGDLVLMNMTKLVNDIFDVL
ncbi:MAG: anti-sigma factor antagonist, partial [Candidatus Krumholzibacteriota bacterium]|nr:anti-sigma factor antagonist [Candidatus Krumholzibacteriota bacterium]